MPRRWAASVGLVAVALATACGGESGTGPANYETIAGTYTGPVAGVSQGITLQATFSVTITQAAGTLGGSYGIVGTLSDGVTTVPVQGTGTLAGTIASGNNPSVNITATSGICPNVRSNFSGTYDSVNHVVTLNGSVYIFDANCTIVLTYAGTIILYR